jgi:tryptophanyl-tRNA synthetase
MQPTGDVHLGNYLGALRNWVAGQHTCDAFHGIVDLHALTVTDEPGVLGRQTMSLAAMFFAIGLEPDVATVFVQSHVPEHNQLGWIMECTVSFGELSRMTQFKDKSAKRRPGCSPIRRCRPPTSCSTTPTRCRSATTSGSTSRSPVTSPSGSTTASATRS